MDNNEYEPSRQRKKPKVKESIIDHTYRDYSQVEVSSDEEGDRSTTDGDKKQSRLQPNFPAKLHAIVSNPIYQHIVCWQPHGRSWKIVDKHLLSTLICPKHFAHAKFESFNRSVNGWGFKRLLNPGPDCKSYYHECFLRGRPELTKLMQRLVNPGKRLPDKAGEPDFYEISRKYPLPPASTTTPDDMTGGMSPHAGRPGQASRFNFQPNQSGYPYGYYPAPYPQLPSPASSAYAAAAVSSGQPFPPQQPQQGYGSWPAGQMPPNIYPPNPAAYGYYPYPQMMMPQGYEQYPHPSMYGQYYPGTPNAYNPASPGRPKDEAEAQGSTEEQDGYPSPGAQPDNSGDVDPGDERKPSASSGVKRPADEDDEYPPQPSAPTYQLEGSGPPPQATISEQERNAEHTDSEVALDAPTKPSSDDESKPSDRREGGGDGPNEQQLVENVFQQ